MPDLFPLSVFPEGALASSIVTTVWVGIFVVCFFNLRLGWVLSGLVVPGYMVPLLFLKPSAALVVFGEGVLTYVVVWFYSEYLSRHFGWGNFFGRDRFFALVLVSVLVRILNDGLLLPVLGEYLNQQWGYAFDYQNNLHSFGLIIVSLIANNFWKTGFRRGLVPLVVTVGVTYVLIRFGLMTFTNFSLSDIGFLYEDISTSILASPKSYIILLTTAFVASRMNLFYGWDFSGILIPSLLALQWYQPEKILYSFVEAFAILAISRALLQAPLFKRVTIEGARKILLFFNVSFAYKIVLSYCLLWWAPQLKVTDYYGFGYVLPTLMAVKMYDKGIVARLTRATLQTSLVAALCASLIGFMLNFLPDPWLLLLARQDREPVVSFQGGSEEGKGLVAFMREEKIHLYSTRTHARIFPPNAAEVDAFSTAFGELDLLKALPDAEAASRLSFLLAPAGYRFFISEGRYLVLHEQEPRKYRGTYVINPAANNDLVIEVPLPLDERGALEAGLWLFRYYNARALLVGGTGRKEGREGGGDVLVNANTLYQGAHRELARSNVVQVRSYTSTLVRQLAGGRRMATDFEVEQPKSSLHVKGEIPDGFSLVRLKALVDDFDIQWRPLSLPNLQRDTVAAGFVELVLNHDDIRRIITGGVADEQGVALQVQDRSIEGYLQDWLLGDRTRLAPAGSNLYIAPSLEQLLYFDDEILKPLLQTMEQHYGGQGWTAVGLQELHLINQAAAVLGYELIRYHHRASGEDFIILGERDDANPRRYWGSFVFRLRQQAPYVFQVPRPLFEVNSLEFATSLFERMHGAALIIAGAHPEANFDRSADLIKFQNRASVFNLVAQAIQRQRNTVPMLTVQSRVLAQRNDLPMPDTDVLLAFADGQSDEAHLSPLAEALRQAIARAGLNYQFAGGRLESAGYDASGVLQALQRQQSQNKEFAIVWISPLARGDYRQQNEPTPQAIQFAALHIATREVDVVREVGGMPMAKSVLPETLRAMIDRYIARQDIALLAEARRRHPSLQFERLVDPGTRQAYLLLRERDGQGGWLALVNLAARQSQRIRLVGDDSQEASLSAFIADNAAWLLAGGGR